MTYIVMALYSDGPYIVMARVPDSVQQLTALGVEDVQVLVLAPIGHNYIRPYLYRPYLYRP